MGSRGSIGLLLLSLAVADGARAEPSSGATVELRLPRVTPGLESKLPRGGAYGRALAAVRGRQYRRARDLFREAAAELRQSASDGTMTRAQALPLSHKAERAALFCSILQGNHVGKAASLFDMHVQDGLALLDLYLTSRAFHGRDDPLLYDRAAKDLDDARKISTAEPGTESQLKLIEIYLAKATLLGAGGDRREARRWLGAVHPSILDRSAAPMQTAGIYLLVAGAHAVLGDRQLALDAIAVARSLHPHWNADAPLLRAENCFDPLRDDPRFVELFGEEE
jgi:hypothetical protein